MLPGDARLGSSALLRVAGLPIRCWLAGANPTLFANVAQLERREQGRHARALQLAERIGEQLVPKPALARDDRAFLLAVRRTLHRGDSIADVSRERLLGVSGLSDGDHELMQALVAMIDRDRTIARLSAAVDADVATEQNRLLTLPQQIADESRVAQALLAAQDGDDPRLADLSRKSRRHRAEHEWRRVARAATGSTPRGWLSHVALVAIGAAETPQPPTVTERFTAQWAENVRAPRLALANPPNEWPEAGTRLAVNPLRWDVDGRLGCVVLDKNREQTQVSVQQTPLLDGILTALQAAAPTFAELAEAVGCANREEWLALRAFVRHLVVLGIVQPAAPPVIRLVREATPGQTFADVAGADGDHGGWIDVYRYAESGLSRDLARDLQRGVSQALRLLSVMRSDVTGRASWPEPTSARSWSFSEILRDDLAIGDTVTPDADSRKDAEDTPAPSSSRFATLVSELVEQAGHTHDVVIDSDLLDKWGAASSALNWPVDCLVRVPAPGSGFTAVLEDVRAPGVLDARFADTLSDLHGAIPQVEAYRAFLRRLEQLTGILFVELLVPPLTDGAANAVRRPIYTSAWTGDPHADGYLRGGADAGTYIPLQEITIRRVDGRLRADVGGQPIWPVYHATRTFEQPWSRVAQVLLATAPVDLPVQCERMTHVLSVLRALLPEQVMVPRISVSGGLVLSPAQWRLPFDQLWDQDAPARAKLRALVGLRDRYALPRWVYLMRDSHKSPVPCDLESLHAFRAIERCTTGRTPLKVVEMLPAPDQLLVVDRAHRSGDRLASQLQLRFPCDESPTAMANRIAPAVCQQPTFNVRAAAH
jgi:hypothetical protein